MKLNPAQLKGRIKSLSQKNHADPRTLLRMYMMERFLERISVSSYKDQFIIKGGILVTSLVGTALRSTMDIDASVKNLNVSEETIQTAISSICTIDLHDGVSFRLKQFIHIMDELEYPGIRITLDALLDAMPVPMKIDISTGDVITPKEIQYQYKLLLEDRFIPLWSYNLETLLAEKLQTVLARGLLNTRMRDFYDLYELSRIYENQIHYDVLKDAFFATCQKHGSMNLFSSARNIIDSIRQDQHLTELWESYRRKYPYAANISYTDATESVLDLWHRITGICALSKIVQ